MPKKFNPEELIEEVKSLRDLVNKQEKRIKQLEERLDNMEVQTDEEDVNTPDQC